MAGCAGYVQLVDVIFAKLGIRPPPKPGQKQVKDGNADRRSRQGF